MGRKIVALLICLALVVLTGSAMAQKPQLQPKEQPTQDKESRPHYELERDKDGNVTKEYYVDGAGKKRLTHEYERDEDGHITEKFYIDLFGNKRLETEYEYHYKDGKLSYVEEWDSEDDFNFRTTYFEGDKPKKVDEYSEGPDNKPRIEKETRYSYDSTGKVWKSEITTHNLDGSTTVTTATWDDAGHQDSEVTETTSEEKGKTKKIKTTKNWHYDINGLPYDYEEETLTDGKRTAYYSEVNEYKGDSKRPTKTIAEKWDPQDKRYKPVPPRMPDPKKRIVPYSPLSGESLELDIIRLPLLKALEQRKVPETPAPDGTTGLKTPTGSGFTPDPNFYVGLYGGPTFGNVNCTNPTFFNRGVDDGIPTTVSGNFASHATTTTNLAGGLKLGAWGTYPGLPPWMKYVGVNLDFTYQNLNLQHQTGYFMEGITPQGGDIAIAGGYAGLSSASGSLTTLGLMFNGRYGFFPNPEVSSFGQFQPYLGVGPVLGIASLAPTFSFINFTNLYGQQVNTPINETHKFSSQTSVFPALGVEAGLRYLPLRNVYLDVSYRYLYGKPSFGFTNADFRFNLTPAFNNHTLRFGVGLMF